MSRDVPFKNDAICDSCGKLGAFDFMGDFICIECMKEDVGDQGASTPIPHHGETNG